MLQALARLPAAQRDAFLLHVGRALVRVRASPARRMKRSEPPAICVRPMEQSLEAAR
jgi:hypothetical protein